MAALVEVPPLGSFGMGAVQNERILVRKDRNAWDIIQHTPLHMSTGNSEDFFEEVGIIGLRDLPNVSFGVRSMAGMEIYP